MLTVFHSVYVQVGKSIVKNNEMKEKNSGFHQMVKEERQMKRWVRTYPYPYPYPNSYPTSYPYPKSYPYPYAYLNPNPNPDTDLLQPLCA